MSEYNDNQDKPDSYVQAQQIILDIFERHVLPAEGTAQYLRRKLDTVRQLVDHELEADSDNKALKRVRLLLDDIDSYY